MANAIFLGFLRLADIAAHVSSPPLRSPGWRLRLVDSSALACGSTTTRGADCNACAPVSQVAGRATPWPARPTINTAQGRNVTVLQNMACNSFGVTSSTEDPLDR